MSTYTLGSVTNLAPSGTGTPNIEQQPKLLEDALLVVKQQGYHMRKSIDSDMLFDALKHASTMLSELRTSRLLPKYYYELYMALFDELRYLTTYLYEVHTNQTHSLSHLYELVQYANTLLPRLYLMITVGSVYMKVSNEYYDSKGKKPDTQPEGLAMPPVKEIMTDLLEMSRGVQHATRGLFLRYYLSGLTRDYLPDCKEGPGGNIKDSVSFVLDNFVEMNKLWVRLQHQGHSRDKDQRELERRELRLLVGSNLVRLSQLEEITLEVYQDQILPIILDEIVGCRDVIAQEYLLDIIIQAFPDEFHLHCLDMYLSAIAGLHPSVNVKTLVISLIDRFAGYAARVREEKSASGAEATGISEDAQLFNVFWEQVNELIEAREEFTIEDIIALFNSIVGLSLNFYPDQLEYVDRVIGMAKLKLEVALKANPDCILIGDTKKFLIELLVAPIHGYKKNILTFLQLPSSSVSPGVEGHAKSSHLGGHFTDFLNLQSFGVRRKVAQVAAKVVLKAHLDQGYLIDTVDGVNFLFGEVCNSLVRDQVDGTIFGPKNAAENDFKDEMTHLDWEDIIEEQSVMAQLIHVLKCIEDNFLQNALLLSTARDHLKESGDIRIRFTFESLVGSMIQLVTRCVHEKSEQYRKNDIEVILKSVLSTIGILGKAREFFGEDWSPTASEEQILSHSANKIGKGLLHPAEMSLQLYLMAAAAANQANEEELCYGSFVEAFSVYEDSISESKAQAFAIMQIISSLYQTTVFTTENYETLANKCTTHSARLLKRADQCRGLLKASHLYWVQDEKKRDDAKPAYKDPKRTLECIQRSLKIADSVSDHAISIHLFVDVLEECLWYYERKHEAMSASYINSLIEMILSNLTHPVKSGSTTHSSLGGPLGVAAKPLKNHSKILLDRSVKHLENIYHHIQKQKQTARALLTSMVPDMESGFQVSGGRWGDVMLPEFDFSQFQ